MSMVALFVTGCKQKSSEDAYVINPDDAIDVLFEDVATDVRVVPLQSDKPIGSCYSMQCIGDVVLILENNYQSVDFFKDGKLLATLNKAGRGRGEYTSINRFCYDPERKVLYVNHNGEKDAILQYSVPEMQYIGTLNVGTTVESIKLYDDNALMLSIRDGNESGCFLYDIESQTITTKVCDLTIYQGQNGDNVLGGFNKKSHLVSLFGATNQLYNYSGKELEPVFMFNYGDKGVDYIYNARLETAEDVDAYGDYINSHGNHFKDLWYPHNDENGVSFWYSTLSRRAKNFHYFRISGEKTVSLKGFNVPGIKKPIIPTCITESGYATIIEGGKDANRDADTPLSPFGQKIIDAMSSQNDDNPVIIYYNIGG